MKKNNKSKINKHNNQSRSRASSEVLFIVFTTFSLIYLLALFTHSSLENPYSSSNVLNATIINEAGSIGAYLSDFSLSVLGYSSYLIPFALIWSGWRVHKNIGLTPINRSLFITRFIAFIVLLLFTSALLSIDTPSPLDGGRPIAGGDVGYSMHSYFGRLFGSASFIMYLGIMMISFSIVSTASWANIFTSTGGVLGVLLSKFKATQGFSVE